MTTFVLSKEEAEIINKRRELLAKRQMEQDIINAREAPRKICMEKYNKQKKYNIEKMFEIFSEQYEKQENLSIASGKYEHWNLPVPDISIIASAEPTLAQNILGMGNYIYGLELYTEKNTKVKEFAKLINKVLKDNGHSTFISEVVQVNRSMHARCSNEYYSCFYPGTEPYNKY